MSQSEKLRSNYSSRASIDIYIILCTSNIASMNLTSLALANLHSEHRQADVSRYVAEQIVLRNSQGSLGDFDWQENLGIQ